MYSKGCDVNSEDTSLFNESCAISKNASTIILVVGLNQSIEQEGQDRVTISFPGVQQLLIDKVVTCADPTASIIVVIMSGGPVDLSALKSNDRIGAIFWVGYPGQAGGTALTNLLFGKSPSGKLPHTV